MKNKKLDLEEKYVFCNEMEIILSSGLGIEEGLSLIQNELPNDHLKSINSELKENYRNLGNLYNAVKKSGCFDHYMEEMINIGESSGNLDDVMQELALYYERENRMQQQIREAVTYPFILIVMMFIIVSIMVFKVLPIFENVIADIGNDLSPLASSLMNFGKGFAFVSMIILIILIVIFVIFFIYIKSSKNQQFSEALIAKLPLTKNLYMEISLARLTYALSLFISSGYPIEEAVKFLPDFITHPTLNKKINNVIDQMNQGTSFVEALNANDVYSGVYANIVTIAMKTGRQDEALKKLTEMYQENVKSATTKFLNIIEPTIIALLSLIVGIILLSIMLPLMSIMSTLG